MDKDASKAILHIIIATAILYAMAYISFEVFPRTMTVDDVRHYSSLSRGY